MYVRSMDQARHSFLALSLNHLASHRHGFSLEIETIRAMQRELASIGSISARTMVAARGVDDVLNPAERFVPLTNGAAHEHRS